MIGWPIATSLSMYVNISCGVLDNTYYENSVLLASCNLAIWIIVGLSLYEKRKK